jgi:hypothetical protein
VGDFLGGLGYFRVLEVALNTQCAGLGQRGVLLEGSVR